LDDPADGAAWAWSIGFEIPAHREKQTQQLTEDHISGGL